MAKVIAEPVRPIIVKKVYVSGHGGHHGGAWKVAYADFVTAMMAFFLLMWLLGATTEKQRKALADYFAPTLVQQKTDSAGGSGFFGGESITSVDKYPERAGQTGTKSMTIPRGAKGGPKEASGSTNEAVRFDHLKQALARQLTAQANLRRFAKNIRFTVTNEGLRIDLVDEADFSMFVSGTDRLTPDASDLLRQVAGVVSQVPNSIIIRGHTDASPWSKPNSMNNWQLSAARAEATRSFMLRSSIDPNRFDRIEGVADREPYVPQDAFDPRNRRMSITLGWGQTPA
jgi:chemotaxis protein MotB